MFVRGKHKTTCNNEASHQEKKCYISCTVVCLLAWCVWFPQCTVTVYRTYNYNKSSGLVSVGSSLYFRALQWGAVCTSASWQGHQDTGFRRGGWECELSRTCRGAQQCGIASLLYSPPFWSSILTHPSLPLSLSVSWSALFFSHSPHSSALFLLSYFPPAYFTIWIIFLFFTLLIL